MSDSHNDDVGYKNHLNILDLSLGNLVIQLEDLNFQQQISVIILRMFFFDLNALKLTEKKSGIPLLRLA